MNISPHDQGRLPISEVRVCVCVCARVCAYMFNYCLRCIWLSLYVFGH